MAGCVRGMNKLLIVLHIRNLQNLKQYSGNNSINGCNPLQYTVNKID